MNKEQLFSLMPKELVKEEDVIQRIEEQKELIEAGIKYVSQLSINRYLHKNLADFSLEERIDLFSELNSSSIINENQLFFYDLDIESFAAILEEEFGLECMYELDNLYIENLLKGIDITNKEIDVFGVKTSFGDILVRFVFQSSGMFMGDTPNLMMMLVAKKALLGSYFAKKNVETLAIGEREIFDISILL